MMTVSWFYFAKKRQELKMRPFRLDSFFVIMEVWGSSNLKEQTAIALFVKLPDPFIKKNASALLTC